MKGKLAVTATLLMAGVLTAPAYAAQGSQLAATFNNQDIQSLFVDNQQPMHLAVLSPMEMKTTQGGSLLQEVTLTQGVLGALTSTSTYTSFSVGHHSPITYEGLAISVVAGFSGGLIGGALGGNALAPIAGGVTEGYITGILTP